jgi:inhibitor of cysteine peptidase
MLQLDSGYAGRVVDLSLGEVVELRLHENPSTGFRWKMTEAVAPVCRIKDDSLQSPAATPPRPGQGGTHVWHIEGVQVGTCRLSLAYLRPWEHGAAPAATFALQINVK